MPPGPAQLEAPHCKDHVIFELGGRRQSPGFLIADTAGLTMDEPWPLSWVQGISDAPSQDLDAFSSQQVGEPMFNEWNDGKHPSSSSSR